MGSNNIAVLQDKEIVMRLIDADAFVKYLENEIRLMEEEGASPYALMIASGAINDVGRQPTIDIVRCKECKWAEPNREGDYDCKCHIPTFRIKANDFCSYGEREGE